jgi:hypothetical protein
MMITTRDLKQPAKVEPKKLNHITTAIVPDAAPQPAPKGDGFAKLITTHDEPKPIKAGDVVYKDAEGRVVAVPAVQASEAEVLDVEPKAKRSRSKKG